MRGLVKITQWFRRRQFLISSMYFSFFAIISPFELTWINFTQGCFAPTLAEIGPVRLWRRFLNIVNVFSLFRYYMYLPLENGMAIHWTNLNSLKPRMLWAKFGWYWPNGAWEEDEKYTGSRTTGDQKSSRAHMIQVNITFYFSYTGPKIDRGSNWLSLIVSSKKIARLSLRQLGN